jgi:hypothetical protein
MIYKRVAARLRAQDWVAITIEIGIVIIGVFIGMQVSNWNADRLEKHDIHTLLLQLRPELEARTRTSAINHDYYAITDRYAKVALAGWAGDSRVTDRDFSIAAYNASQIISGSLDGNAYSLLLGGEQIRKIDDPVLRSAVVRLLSYDYSPVGLAAVRSAYRDDVRKLLPQAVQEKVRAECGDRVDGTGHTMLAPTCTMTLDPALAASAARALRTHPELAGELRQHLSLVATYLFNLDQLQRRTNAVRAALDSIK